MDSMAVGEPFMDNQDAFMKVQAAFFHDFKMNDFGVRVLGIHYMDNGPLWMIKKHKHSFFEFHYVVRDDVITQIGEQEFLIDSGHYYLLPPGVMHAHRQDNGKGHIGFALRWECGIEYFHKSVPYPVRDDGSVLQEMLRLLRLADTGGVLMELQAAFLQLILLIARKCSHLGSDTDSSVDQTAINNHMIDTAIRFIEENYAQDIDVHDVAASAHVSYSHLSRLFKAYTGETVNRYINRMRRQRAEYLLKCTTLSIGVISSETGFKSEYYFSSFFKKETGVSPASYRKSSMRLTE